MKKSGKCVKCGSVDIRILRTAEDRSHVYYGQLISPYPSGTMKVDTFVCMDCGYIEEYLDLDMKPSKLKEAKDVLKKINPEETD
ncbi:MAG: hypothetical protein MRY83_21325 [Flavobacteriales bacterium]|nr:hypothetical protein [Flavobacteriales bacterium]